MGGETGKVKMIENPNSFDARGFIQYATNNFHENDFEEGSRVNYVVEVDGKSYRVALDVLEENEDYLVSIQELPIDYEDADPPIWGASFYQNGYVEWLYKYNVISEAELQSILVLLSNQPVENIEEEITRLRKQLESLEREYYDCTKQSTPDFEDTEPFQDAYRSLRSWEDEFGTLLINETQFIVISCLLKLSEDLKS